MTALLRRAPGTAPPALSGPGHDRLLGVLVTALENLWMRPVGARSYDAARGLRDPAPPLVLRLVDRAVVARSEDVAALTFAHPDGADLPAWQPGCHLDFHLPSGLRRQYSLCGDPQDRSVYRVAVRKIPDGGGGSAQMHALAVGDAVTVRGPRNGFPFTPRPRMLFIAGGIGVTPILPMVRAAQRLGLDWHFLYSGRSRDTLPFLDEVAAWDLGRVTVRLDEEHGVPTAADLLAPGTSAADGADAAGGCAVYVCGPPPMIEAVRAGLGQGGRWGDGRREGGRWEGAALHFERFSAPPVRDGAPFEVQLARTGEVLQVPSDESALAVIRRARPDVGYSCQQGFCGSCKVRVLAGQVEHHDTRLAEADRADSMLICVSRSQGGRLVLDL